VASDASCIRSPNYPSNYNIYDACTITVAAHEAVKLSVVAFDLEYHYMCHYDSLTVNSIKYCGTSGPDGVQVAAGATITFKSDFYQTRSGFEVCGASPRAPTRHLSLAVIEGP
jgi:hypothetical protein